MKSADLSQPLAIMLVGALVLLIVILLYLLRMNGDDD